MRLHDFLEYRARVSPELEFIVMGDTRLTYAEADAAANRVAHALIEAGLSVGDRAAILAKNCIEYVLFYYGASKAGVVPVPLNYRLAPPEWAFIAGDAGAKFMLAKGELVEAVDSIRGELTNIKHWMACGAEQTGWDDWSAATERQPSTAPARTVTSDDDVYQMYTSGTTGRPKGAVISHSALVANLFQISTPLDTVTGDRSLIVAPLYHAAAGVVTFLTVAQGGSLFVQEEFDPAEVVRALSEEQIAAALLVPAMIQFCLVAVPDVADRDYSHLKTIIYGASAIAEQTLRKAVETFGCDFLQAYGMTETTAAATNLLPADHSRALREKPELLLSCGRPVLGTQVRLVDEDGEDVAVGAVGEVLIRGPQLMKGYWNRPEATAEALKDGWMHTGDAGRSDDEGYIYIQDRVKDMIVSGGENIYPREIEDVLYEHEAVAEAAVFGVPDEKWGEAVKAVVVLKADRSASADELLEFCRSRLGGFKQPRSLDFIEALPRNLSGKVLKKDLREPYWRGRDRRVN